MGLYPRVTPCRMTGVTLHGVGQARVPEDHGDRRVAIAPQHALHLLRRTPHHLIMVKQLMVKERLRPARKHARTS